VLKAAKAAGWTPGPGSGAEGFDEIKIYEDEILVITNKANKVKKLSAEELRGIFSGAITNWKEVGGKDLPILIVIPEKGRATRQVFQDAVMGGAPFTRCIDSTPTAKVDDIVRVNESAIGFTSKAFFYRGKLKIVDTVGVKRPLLLITKGKPSPAVAKLGGYLKGAGRKYWEYQDLSLFWLTID
jgi:phosphate transport system substrate-binding protein